MNDTNPIYREDIPDTVKDVLAYKRYLQLKDSSVVKRDLRMIATSDVELTIDPLANIATIRRQIEDLPEKEIEDILRRTKAVKSISGRIGRLKTQAFGLHRGVIHHSLTMGLLDERASELIEYFGRMKSIKEVHRIIKMDWMYEVSHSLVTKFRAKYKDKIDLQIAEFKQSHDNIRLAHKRGRLEELTDLYNDRKLIYQDSQKGDDYKLMLQTLKLIHDEVEGTNIKINGEINHKVEVTLNNHVQKEIMKGLTINDIIIARVAHRMNINPAFIISRLRSSYYAKHSGLVRPDVDDLMEQEVTYPSQMVYNWNEIEKIHSETGDVGTEEAEWEEVTPEEDVKSKSVKDIMIERLQQRKVALSQASSRVVTNTERDNDQK